MKSLRPKRKSYYTEFHSLGGHQCVVSILFSYTFSVGLCKLTVPSEILNKGTFIMSEF